MQWCCKHGHVLGLVSKNGSGVTRLLVYRQAVDLSVEKPRPVEVMAVVEGQVFDIRCSVCGEMRTWMPGEGTLNALVDRVLSKRKEVIG